MNSADARQVVLTSIAATGTLSVFRRVSAGDVPDVPRVVIGSFGAAILLMYAADFAPSLAAGIALLILAGSVFGNGPQLWTALSTGRLAPKNRKPSKATP